MNDFLQEYCERCKRYHPKALSCVIISLQEEARKSFDEWFYAHYTEQRRKQMYLDAVLDMNRNVVFNSIPIEVKEFLEKRTIEENAQVSVCRGVDLKFFSVEEYLGQWTKKNEDIVMLDGIAIFKSDPNTVVKWLDDLKDTSRTSRFLELSVKRGEDCIYYPVVTYLNRSKTNDWKAV